MENKIKLENQKIKINKKEYTVIEILPTPYSTFNFEEQQFYFDSIRGLIEQFERFKILVFDDFIKNLELPQIVNVNNEALEHYYNIRSSVLNYIKEEFIIKKYYILVEEERNEALELVKNTCGKYFNSRLCSEKELIELVDKMYKYQTFHTAPNTLDNICEEIDIGVQKIKKNDYYYSVLKVNSYPEHVNDFFLSKVYNINNALITIDFEALDDESVEKDISSTKENAEEKMHDDKKTSRYRGEKEYRDSKHAYDKIFINEEKAISTTVEIHLKEKNEEALENREKEIMKYFRIRRIKIFPVIGKNTLYETFQNIFTLKEECINFFTSYQISCSGLFNGGAIIDEDAFFLGTNELNIPVFLNMFIEKRGTARKSFDGFIFAIKGAGKTTLIKKIAVENTLKGIKSIIFDIEGDYSHLVKNLGGRVVHITGKDKGFNIMRRFSMFDTLQENIEVSTTKIKIFFNSLAKFKDVELLLLDPILADYYKEERNHRLDDFQKYIKSRENDTTRSAISKINIIVDSIMSSESKKNLFMYDNEDTGDDKLLVYNIKGIKTLDDVYFRAMLLNIISSVYQDVTIDKINFKQILIDEAHSIINTKYMEIVEYLSKLFLQGRKYRVGTMPATQSFSHMVKKGASDEAIGMITDLVDQSTYLFFGRQSKSVCENIKANVDIDEYYLKQIPKLVDLQFVLYYGDDHTKFDLYMHDEDWKYFDTKEVAKKYEKEVQYE